ncbi:MAG: hypothetical protein K1000chlam3_00739, partial [Chlamydiae bacterium]|nr:hypothetical protein [Chlamydiota bacterium]
MSILFNTITSYCTDLTNFLFPPPTLKTNLEMLLWAQQNNLNFVKEIIEKGDLELLKAKNNDGNTLLHWAMLQNRTEIAKLLIKKVIEKGDLELLKAKDHHGNTPLHYA